MPLSREENDVMRWAGRGRLDQSAREQSTGNTVCLTVELSQCLSVLTAYFPVVSVSAINLPDPASTPVSDGYCFRWCLAVRVSDKHQ